MPTASTAERLKKHEAVTTLTAVFKMEEQRDEDFTPIKPWQRTVVAPSRAPPEQTRPGGHAQARVRPPVLRRAVERHVHSGGLGGMFHTGKATVVLNPRETSSAASTSSTSRRTYVTTGDSAATAHPRVGEDARDRLPQRWRRARAVRRLRPLLNILRAQNRVYVRHPRHPAVPAHRPGQQLCRRRHDRPPRPLPRPAARRRRALGRGEHHRNTNERAFALEASSRRGRATYSTCASRATRLGSARSSWASAPSAGTTSFGRVLVGTLARGDLGARGDRGHLTTRTATPSRGGTLAAWGLLVRATLCRRRRPRASGRSLAAACVIGRDVACVPLLA